MNGEYVWKPQTFMKEYLWLIPIDLTWTVFPHTCLLFIMEGKVTKTTLFRTYKIETIFLQDEASYSLCLLYYRFCWLIFLVP